MSTIDINKVRADFPTLKQKIRGKDLVYLDNAATSHKPQCVIDAIEEFYRDYNSNIHRGVHKLSQIATDKYENARKIVKEYINADTTEEIIFTKGTTDSVNLVANSFGRKYLKEGDEVLISHMEHHSNIVPWQLLCEQIGCVLKVAPINDKGEIIWEEFENLLSEKTKLLSVVHISNSLGTINPIKKIIDAGHSRGIPVMMDAAQSIHHVKIDVKELDVDFLVFSGHKIYGPTGIGVLYGKKKYLNAMPPYQGGGDMILSVSFEKTIYNELPAKFEAGTPNIAGAIGLGAAIKYISELGLDNIAAYEKELLDYATEKVSAIPGVRIIGTADHKASVLSFVMEAAHPHDVGTMMDMDGVAIRTGHHCTEPVMKRFDIPATSRASFSFYNTKEEIDVLVKSIEKIIDMFS
jgi:cysteine desulfurase/selenocysteine lyase